MQAQDLLRQTDKLPNVPDVVRELIQLLSDPDVNYSELTEKVSHDQTISLKVLRVVNSAYFGLSRKISSIDEATVLLGTDKLKTLVIASGFASSVSKVEGLKLPEFWADSFRVAELAQWLAKRTPLVQADEAFTVGIVHNIGRLLLHLTEPTIAQEIQELVANRKAGRVKAEQDLLGFTSQDAGKALMDLWKFPAGLGLAVQLHKRPFANEEPNPLACVLNLACYLNACIRAEREYDLVREGFPMAVAKAAGLNEGVVYELDDALMIGDGLNQLI
ncbi:MAG: HDOD domain-containing protein [Marinomonas foliarum]|uniref:HD-like signal output (HDOD) protein n=1 Tax=Marinomonas foliarum TaxID=491950 RepID=A0A368ZMK1_9GAMM|nr:HDOD domain-containing protein [Marinomonas foliarum]QRV25074.1 HDOD domain-containing protein [Marinomonas foliarum]RCW95959.1 HD-like signal output (HDOD) protein [Marinomonas foliarum]